MPRHLFSISPCAQDGNNFAYEATLNPDSPIFAGHFEGMPVVPGVCTLTMIKQCLEHALAQSSLHYAHIKECKFLRSIIPHDHKSVMVQLSLKPDNHLMAVVSSEGTPMLKLKAQLAPYD